MDSILKFTLFFTISLAIGVMIQGIIQNKFTIAFLYAAAIATMSVIENAR